MGSTKLKTLNKNTRTAWLLERSYPSPEAPLALPRFIEFLWRIRNGLENINCDTIEGRFALLLWWVSCGDYEYPLVEWTLSEDDLNYLYTFPADWRKGKLPKIFLLYMSSRPDLKTTVFDDDQVNSYKYIYWWMNEGVKEELPKRTAERFLSEIFVLSYPEMPAPYSITRFMEVIWRMREDLAKKMDINSVVGRIELLNWWRNQGYREYRELSKNILAASATGFFAPSRAMKDFDTNLLYILDNPKFSTEPKPVLISGGINIVGYASGVLGIGEDARMVIKSCEVADINTVVVEPMMLGMPPKLDHTLASHIRKDLVFDKTLFCLPAPEMVRLAFENQSDLINNNGYNIGIWPWELPHWPSEFKQIGQLVDEVWAISHFVQQAFTPLMDKPVLVMPLPLEVQIPSVINRNKFNLPTDIFLFLIMFDGNSRLTRKNPLAAVQAFLKAFQGVTSGVGLVIKVMNLWKANPLWQKILTLVQNDSRVIIVDSTLNRVDTIELMACCDAFISLHRSEGFGRVIAESILLRKPVIVSRFSGNLDFCTEDTAFLVEGETIPLQKDDYVLAISKHEQQYWYDPNIDQAAEQLVMVVEDSKKREKMVTAAEHFMKTNYSIASVATRYKDRIYEIDTRSRAKKSRKN